MLELTGPVVSSLMGGLAVFSYAHPTLGGDRCQLALGRIRRRRRSSEQSRLDQLTRMSSTGVRSLDECPSPPIANGISVAIRSISIGHVFGAGAIGNDRGPPERSPRDSPTSDFRLTPPMRALLAPDLSVKHP